MQEGTQEIHQVAEAVTETSQVEQPQPTTEDHPTVEDPKKIIIIGSGISGLILFHILTKAGKPVELYTKSTDFTTEKSPFIILWKSALKVLLKLGFGKRLSSITYPLVSLKSTEMGQDDQVLVDFKPEKSNDPNDEYAYLPAGVSVRQIDLIRMLLISLTPSSHLVVEPDSPLVLKPAIPGTTMEASLAYPSWFTTENYQIPNLYFNKPLESYLISSEYGTVYTKFSDSSHTRAFMLLGADGSDSVVRSLMNDRVVQTLTKQVLITGVSNVIPSIDVSEVLPSGNRVAVMSRREIVEFIPEGSARSWVGKECVVGIVNMGESIGWRVLYNQARPGLHAERFVMPKRRKELGVNLGSIQNIHKPGISVNPEKPFHDKMLSGGSAGEWQIPSGNGSESSTPRVSSTAPPPKPKMQVIPEIPSVAFDSQILSENLTGTESRDLALSLLEPNSIPHECLSIIASSDPLQTFCMDNFDSYGDTTLKSFTSPNFHPGRVMLVGDAAHTLAVSGIGNHGAALAILDSKCLADLIIEHLGTCSDAEALERISKEYTKTRLDIGNKCIADAHVEATWMKQEDGIWKRIVGSVVGNTWCRSKTFEEMQLRGE